VVVFGKLAGDRHRSARTVSGLLLVQSRPVGQVSRPSQRRAELLILAGAVLRASGGGPSVQNTSRSSTVAVRVDRRVAPARADRPRCVLGTEKRFMKKRRRKRREATVEASYVCDVCGEEIVIPIVRSVGESQ